MSSRWTGREGNARSRAETRENRSGGKGRGAGGRAGAVAHLRGPLVGVQGEFLERAGERRAPLARGLHIGIRGGEPPVRVGGAFVSRRDGHVVRDRTRAASDFGRRVRARTSAGFGWVGGRVSVLSRGGARVAGTRRALRVARAAARSRDASPAYRFSARARWKCAHRPTNRRNASGRLSTSARTRARDPHSSLPLRRSDRAAAKVVSGRRARARRRVRCPARPRGECGAAAEAHHETSFFPHHTPVFLMRESKGSREPPSRRVARVDGHF